MVLVFGLLVGVVLGFVLAQLIAKKPEGKEETGVQK